jgi:hypothetical protein
LDVKDKIAFFVFCIYRYHSNDRNGNLNRSPHKKSFYLFAANHVADKAFVRSMNRYEGSDLRVFGRARTADGYYFTGGSTGTLAYKCAYDYLRSHDLIN